jgi:hypothetical protein
MGLSQGELDNILKTRELVAFSFFWLTIGAGKTTLFRFLDCASGDVITNNKNKKKAHNHMKAKQRATSNEQRATSNETKPRFAILGVF